MTKAKYLHGKEKSEATRASFEKKISTMSSTLGEWRMNGEADDRFWPKSLKELASWDDPTKGIHRWRSNSITDRKRSYGDLVHAYWSLQNDARPFIGKNPLPKGDAALRQKIRVLALQNTRLLWRVQELEDALSRVDSKNKALSGNILR